MRLGFSPQLPQLQKQQPFDVALPNIPSSDKLTIQSSKTSLNQRRDSYHPDIVPCGQCKSQKGNDYDTGCYTSLDCGWNDRVRFQNIQYLRQQCISLSLKTSFQQPIYYVDDQQILRSSSRSSGRGCEAPGCPGRPSALPRPARSRAHR